MFANCQLMGMDLAIPDVCKTPAIPIPYPNFALGPTAIPKAWNILYLCTPAHNLATRTPITFGDNAGIGLGVAVQSVMGQSQHTLGAFTLLVKGSAQTRLTSMTRQNRGNAMGMRIVPSQPKILVLMA
ncbi:DUF4150 domain-containing protein [Variovorax boronicumulans]|uniref:DUF4150 domain-containing protein n=1 Tax=Variovorax boronicumulans TaxID=436515 RepID=UPI00339263C8